MAKLATKFLCELFPKRNCIQNSTPLRASFFGRGGKKKGPCGQTPKPTKCPTKPVCPQKESPCPPKAPACPPPAPKSPCPCPPKPPSCPPPATNSPCPCPPKPPCGPPPAPKPPCPCPPKPPTCPPTSPPCPPKPPSCPPPSSKTPCPCPPKPPSCPPPASPGPCPPKPPACPPPTPKPPCPCPPKPPTCPPPTPKPPCPPKPPTCPPSTPKPPCPCPPKTPTCPPKAPSPCPPKSSTCPPPASKSPCPSPPSKPKEPCCPNDCPCRSSAIIGKVAVITGGSVGIGYHCAQTILKNGGKVMLGDVKVEDGKKTICKIVEEFGYDKAAFIKCDVTKNQDMECLFDAALSEFKKIDIVINNAGILQDKHWAKTVDINVKGVICGTLLGFKYMRKNRDGGTIINVSSIFGHESCYACPVYCGTKHFIVGFSRSMGSDYYYCQTGVKVMTLCPGITITSMVEDSGKNPQLEGFGDISKELHSKLYSGPQQLGEVCGMHIVPILEAGVNGSDWISEDSETYRVKVVDRKTLRIS